jgi:hypothetical protein
LSNINHLRPTRVLPYRLMQGDVVRVDHPAFRAFPGRDQLIGVVLYEVKSRSTRDGMVCVDLLRGSARVFVHPEHLIYLGPAESTKDRARLKLHREP